jgi:hypothetical protein
MSKGGGVNIPSDYTVKIESDGSTFHVDADLDNIHVKELAPIDATITVKPLDIKIEPLKSEIDVKPLDIKIEPLKSEIDVKPLAVDSCQTVKLAPLPPVCMETPYSQHLAVTFLGFELWGLTITGRSETYMHSPPKQRHFSVETGTRSECGEPPRVAEPAVARRAGGLRVRVK